LIAAGLLAAGIFALVSVAAKLKYGLSLGSTQFDQVIYGALSLGAELMKVALPLVALILWRKGYRLLSATGAVFWCGLVAFSLAAAVGFAASTRGETVAANMTVIDNRKSWEAKIERVEQELVSTADCPASAFTIQIGVNETWRISCSS
jgi:hypothetical protein